MFASTALEMEEATWIKQEEMVRDFDMWDDPAKSNDILVKLANSAKVVDSLKDLKYKVMLCSRQFHLNFGSIICLLFYIKFDSYEMIIVLASKLMVCGDSNTLIKNKMKCSYYNEERSVQRILLYTR